MINVIENKINQYAFELNRSIQDLSVLVSFSAGIDSTVLSSLMVELKEKIRVMGEIFSNDEPKIGQNVTMQAFFDTRPHYSFTVKNN